MFDKYSTAIQSVYSRQWVRAPSSGHVTRLERSTINRDPCGLSILLSAQNFLP